MKKVNENIRKYGYWNKLLEVSLESPKFENSSLMSRLVKNFGYTVKPIEIRRDKGED